MTYIQGVSSHAQDRALEYLGYEPDRDTWMAVIEAIGTKQAILAHVDPHGTQRWRVTLDDQAVEIVWNPVNQVIVTMIRPAARHSTHHARKLPRNGIGPATRSETHTIRLRGKPIRLRKVWR